jgi:hypothetical protein
MSSDQPSATKHSDALRRFGVAPLVSLLFASSGPATVVRFVVSVIVDAIKRMIGGRTSAHVGQEVFVRTAPPIAHLESATAVTWIPLVRRIRATLTHINPCVVLGRPLAATGIAVSRVAGAAFVAVITAAAQRLPVLQVGPLHDPFIAALAPAQKIRSRAFCGAGYDRQSADLLAAEILKCHGRMLPRRADVS